MTEHDGAFHSAFELPLDFSEDELSAALGLRAEQDLSLLPALDDDGPVEPSSELLAVSRRIAGQFVDLIQAFAATVFSRRLSPQTTSQFAHAVDALGRLAGASHDKEQSRLLDEMQALLTVLQERQARGRGLETFATQLRAWIPSFAHTLDAADAARLTNLVSYKNQQIPLFSELGNIEGIGRKRLERLYCAGLYTVEAVAEAAPADLAQVTGLPIALAARVIEATRDYAVGQRRRCVIEMRDRTRELSRALAMSPEIDPELALLAMSTMAEIQKVLRSLSASQETP